MKRITSIVLTLVMMLSIMTVGISGVNADIIAPGGNGESVVTLTVTTRNLRVTVPSILPIDVDSDNNVTVATNAKIANLSDGPIEVTNVAVDPQNSWTIVPFTTDFTKVPVDTKQYGMTMYNDDVVDGVPAILFDVIEGDSELAVVYDGNVAIQSNPIDHLDIGHVVFTVAWNNSVRLGPNDITYNVENTDVQTYMSTAAYDSSDYSYTNFTPKTLSRADRPAAGTMTVPSGSSYIEVTAEDSGNSFTDSISGSTYNVENLIPGVVYDYSIYDSSDNVLKSGKIYPTGSVRMINGGGNTFNIRDVGGIQADGGTLKYGLLYRGSELNDNGSNYNISLSQSDADYFKNFLGIGAELDLRSDAETSGIDWSALGSTCLYQHNPLQNYSAALRFYPGNRNPGQTCVDRTIINYIADNAENGIGTYVHCLAGADRTATVLFIIEALCGVSQSDIDRDYEMTSFSSGNQRLRTFENYRNMVSYINKMNGSTLREKAVSYALKMGITIEDINRLRNALIDGSPAPVQDLSTPYVDKFDASAATLNSRINSSNVAVSYSNGYLVTDYIPVTPDTLVKISSDKSLKTSSYAGQMSYYDSNKDPVGTTYNSESLWTLSADQKEQKRGMYTMDSTYHAWYANTELTEKPVYYIRVCIPYTDINNVHVYVKEV